MRTNDLKAMAEENEEEYELAKSEAYEEWAKGKRLEVFDFPDIFTWVGMEYMTAQEEMNDYRRDEGLL